MEVNVYTYSNSVPDGGEWLASCSGCFVSGESATSTHGIGDWVGPADVMDVAGRRKIPLTIAGIKP
jgi:hypothetical protein